jgi:hypothetical protein
MASSGLFDTSTGKIAAAFLPPSGGGGGLQVLYDGDDTPFVPAQKPGNTIVGTTTYTPTASGVAVITGTAQVSFTVAAPTNDAVNLAIYKDGAPVTSAISTNNFVDGERSMTQQVAINVTAGVAVAVSLVFECGGANVGAGTVEQWSISVITP